jgi:hypothetical protein
MEILTTYFAISDNFIHFQHIMRNRAARRNFMIDIRTDSNPTVEQLKGICGLG